MNTWQEKRKKKMNRIHSTKFKNKKLKIEELKKVKKRKLVDKRKQELKRNNN